MRVFLDTNVLVSAFLSRGLCADLLKIVLRDHDLVVSPLVLVEFERVLRFKLCASESDLKLAMTVFDSVEVLADPSTLRMDPALASADAAILAAAIGGGVDIFVTGDRGVLTAAGRVPLVVVSPRRFMELVSSSPGTYPLPPQAADEPKVSDRVPRELADMAFEFARKLIALCRSFAGEQTAVLAAELLRAGAAIGIALEEGAGGQTPRPTERARQLALQGARATEYWLRLLGESGVLPDPDVQALREDCRELNRRLGGLGSYAASVEPSP